MNKYKKMWTLMRHTLSNMLDKSEIGGGEWTVILTMLKIMEQTEKGVE